MHLVSFVLVLCCVLVVASADSTLLNLLTKLMNEDDKRSRGDCQKKGSDASCNGGKCADSEDPWGLGFYCNKCPGGTGGYTCEVDDPCTNNPCAAGQTCYGPVSMDPKGRYCYDSRMAGDVFSRISRKVDAGDMKPSEVQGLVSMMQSSDFDGSINALRRVME